MRKGKALLFCAALIASVARAADLTTVTFDELPEQPLNGTSVKGVTFEFTGSTPRMEVALFGATRLSFAESKLLHAPWIEAPTVSGLTMRFAQPTPFVSFDLGYAGGAPLTPGYIVNLFSGATQIGSTPVNTAIGGINPFSFNEGKFTYNDPSQPLTAVTLTLAQPPPSDIFVIDNVTIVPEPSTVALFIVGTLAAVRFRTRRAP